MMDINNWLVFVLLYGAKVSTNSVTSYQYGKNCTVNDRLHCHVEENSCTLNPSSDNAPGAPFDLRVHQALAAVPFREPDPYQLWVNISWHPPYDASITKVRGFELNVVDKESNKQWCFSFYLNETSRWEERDKHNLPKFRFWTKDVFEFGRKYYIEVQSLPKSTNHSVKSNFIAVDNVQMPEHPGISNLIGDPAVVLQKGLESTGWFEAPLPDGAVNCTNFAHADANKWIAAFRYINVRPFPRQIMVDFIAAPPQYCFEAYELRLLKAHHSIVMSTIITKDFLYDELFGNITVSYGNHTFENVVPGFYDIAIVPIDRALNGRCLCPLPSKICTCSQAIWSDVELKDSVNKKPLDPCDYLPPIRDPYLCRNQSVPVPPSMNEERTDDLLSKGVPLLIILLLLTVFFIVAGVVFLCFLYKKYKAKDVMYMIPIESTDFSPSIRETYTIKPIRLLVIYSHDCPLHDEVVSSLVAYLQSKCKCNVHADFLCRREIAKNKFDWLYQSIKAADKVLIVLSYGAYMRYQARFLSHNSSTGDENESSTYVVERKDTSEFDDLFLSQLDLLTSYFCGGSKNETVDRRKLITLRFPYTPVDFSLPHFQTYVRYEIPKHFKSLACHLHNLSEDVDVTEFKQINESDFSRSAEGYRLRKALDDMKEYVDGNTDWFEKLHVRKFVDVSTTPMIVDYKVPQPFVPTKNHSNEPTKPIANGTLMDQRPNGNFVVSYVPEKSPLLTSNGHCLLDVDDDLGVASHRHSLTNGELLTADPLLSKNLDSCDSGIGADLNGGLSTTISTGRTISSSLTDTPTKKKLGVNNDDFERHRLLIS